MISGALTRDDLVRAVLNLNSLTRDGNLSWHTCESGASSALGSVLATIGNARAFCAIYEGRTLRITSLGSKDQETYRLQILDREGGRTIYEFPTVQGIADLYFTVEISVANVEKIIRSLAGKPD